MRREIRPHPEIQLKKPQFQRDLCREYGFSSLISGGGGGEQARRRIAYPCTLRAGRLEKMVQTL